MTSYLLFPLLLIFNVHFQKLQADLYPVKYLSAIMMCAASFFLFTAFSLVGEHSLHFDFLHDYRFYLSQGLLISLILVQIEGRKQCENNIPIFNFSNFLVISAAPIASVMIELIMPFEKSVDARYASSSSIYLMCGITLVLTAIYYRTKFQSGAIDKFRWLALNILVGTLSIVLHAKMIQEYDAYSYLIATNGINIFVFLALSRMNKEKYTSSSCKVYYPILVKVTFFYCLTQLLNTEIVTHLPVEQYVSIRSAGLVLAGYLYHYLLDKRVLFNWKDITILSAIMATQILFT